LQQSYDPFWATLAISAGKDKRVMQQSTQRLMGQDATSEELAVRISAWMDGDDPSAMPEDLHSRQGQQTWQMYHLIGDVLRTPELAQRPTDNFSKRLSDALAAEPTILVPAVARSRRSASWMRRYGLPGFAMAAAVASVVWVARPLFVPEVSGGLGQVAASAPLNILASRDDTASVQSYLDAHRQIAGPTAVRQVSFGTSR
jgi:sigma-E factor negative regulatory protein RseA